MPIHSFRFKTRVLFFLVALCLGHATLWAQSPELPLQELLRRRIEPGGVPAEMFAGGERLYASVVLPIFYQRRDYRPAWIKGDEPSSQVESLLRVIREADREGLRPADYHLVDIETVLSEIRQTQEGRKQLKLDRLADLDLLLTDAFLILGSHLLSGRINPQSIDPQWFVNRREADLAQVLEEALKANQVEMALNGLLPSHAGYARLRKALAGYRRIAANGGWPVVPEGAQLEKGDRNDRVLSLRRRLAREGFLDDEDGADARLFDEALERALRKFQGKYGLEVDGVLGPQTAKALNISADERVRQIIVNLERWRWLPQELGLRYILVNIASFNLDVIEKGQLVMDMRVVAGKPYHRTPVFSGRMTYLVMNPYWNVPARIARKELLPKVKKDPAFLTKESIKVLEAWGPHLHEIDPARTDWQAVSPSSFRYQFRQDPGPQNALGRIKFIFPNQFDVYLHDTPSKNLFARARRDFSHGCIRLEKPIELAEYLLKDDPKWPPAKIRATVTGGVAVEQIVRLSEPVNVHLLYWTVWIGQDDLIHFGPDIYDRDRALDAAMQAPPPRA
ncbi:MAG: L,D-transpeptidase family protein [Desulfobacterales bacterium]|nr:MAG: L,D-transpeptidase family protein [Desulfobacterales bacterium]